MAVTPEITSQPYERKYPDRMSVPAAVPAVRPVIIETTAPSSCSCATGSGFEQKIKENPMFFVLGALLVGYLLAKH